MAHQNPKQLGPPAKNDFGSKTDRPFPPRAPQNPYTDNFNLLVPGPGVYDGHKPGEQFVKEESKSEFLNVLKETLSWAVGSGMTEQKRGI